MAVDCSFTYSLILLLVLALCFTNRLCLRSKDSLEKALICTRVVNEPTHYSSCNTPLIDIDYGAMRCFRSKVTFGRNRDDASLMKLCEISFAERVCMYVMSVCMYIDRECIRSFLMKLSRHILQRNAK